MLELLDLPTAIITDLDIKRGNEGEGELSQVGSLDGRTTTNPTLKHFAKSAKLSNRMIESVRSRDKINIFTQTECSGYYPTSFEEALILQNADNPLLHSALARQKPQAFKGIVGNPEAAALLRENSYEYYCKLLKSKGNFAIELLHGLTTTQEDGSTATLLLPEYIQAAFTKLGEQLGGERDA